MKSSSRAGSIHGGRTDEAGDECRRGPLVDLKGAADLLRTAGVHDDQPVPKRGAVHSINSGHSRGSARPSTFETPRRERSWQFVSSNWRAAVNAARRDYATAFSMRPGLSTRWSRLGTINGAVLSHPSDTLHLPFGEPTENDEGR